MDGKLTVYCDHGHDREPLGRLVVVEDQIDADRTRSRWRLYDTTGRVMGTEAKVEVGTVPSVASGHAHMWHEQSAKFDCPRCGVNVSIRLHDRQDALSRYDAEHHDVRATELESLR